MSIEYDYSDPDKLWPCLGPMTVDELNQEWLRCYKLCQLGGGDCFQKVWFGERLMVSGRMRNIEHELLVREFLYNYDCRYSMTMAGVEHWRFDKFMGRV